MRAYDRVCLRVCVRAYVHNYVCVINKNIMRLHLLTISALRKSVGSTHRDHGAC